MSYTDTPLTRDELLNVFSIALANKLNIPGYSDDDIIVWCATRFSGFYSIYERSSLIEHIRYAWAVSSELCIHLIATTQYDYNPIENYSMTEESTDKDESTATATGSGTVQNKQATYLATGSEYPENSSVSASSSESIGNTTRMHTFTRNGNIGVTTTQQMIDAERKIAVEPLEYLYNIFVCCFTI